MSRYEPPRANKNSSTQQEITQQPLASIFRTTDDSEMLPLDNEIVVSSSTSSGSETETENDELNDNTQPLPEDQPDKLDNYHGFKMDYPAVHKRNRSRKIRTCARVKGVPPSSRKNPNKRAATNQLELTHC